MFLIPHQHTKLWGIFMDILNIIIDVCSQLCIKVIVSMKTCIFTWINSYNYTSIISHTYSNTIHDTCLCTLLIISMCMCLYHLSCWDLYHWSCYNQYIPIPVSAHKIIEYIYGYFKYYHRCLFITMYQSKCFDENIYIHLDK